MAAVEADYIERLIAEVETHYGAIPARIWKRKFADAGSDGAALAALVSELRRDLERADSEARKADQTASA